MKKIYEEPMVDIEKFQFVQVLGISRDDPVTDVTDPFGEDPTWVDPWDTTGSNSSNSFG